MPKKTLITKMFIDVSDFSDAVIEPQKAFMRVAVGEDTRIEFEVIIENEASDNATAERLLRQVRAEFKVNDEGKDGIREYNEGKGEATEHSEGK